MSAYKKIGFSLGNSNPIVLDIGEVYTKLGFAGESEPRAVIPTTIQQIGGPVSYILKSDRTAIVGHHHNTSIKKSITKFLERIFYKELQISSKNQRVILCESLLNPTKIRQEIAEVLFYHFEVASLLFAPHHLLSCFTVATGTALVVDCSYGETLVVPVIEGTPILWAWQAAPLGGAAIHNEIMNKITESGKVQVERKQPENVTSRLSDQVLEDIKVKACFVTEYERAKCIQKVKLKEWKLKNNLAPDTEEEAARPSPNVQDMIYPLDGVTRLIIPGSVREDAAEVLFEQDNERISVSTLVLDSLLQCPLVSRKELAGSLLVTGGTSMLSGFRHRLLFELKELVKSEERYSQLSGFEFRVHNPPAPANLVAWLGAAIFASLETFQRRMVTKEYFEQHNKTLPDWCGPPFPKRMPEQTSPYMTSLHLKGLPQLPIFKPK